MPAAPINDPINMPIPFGTAHDPEHCTSTIEYPIDAPASPAMQTPTKAKMRARILGSAESGREDVAHSSFDTLTA